MLDKNLKSYFSLINKWKKEKDNLKGCPRFPRYKHKTQGRNLVVFTNQQCPVKDGLIYFPGKAGLAPLKTKVHSLQQVRIVPQASCYVVEVVYEGTQKELLQNPNKAAIDLGINNLATLTFNNERKTYVVSGKPLKSINQYYNKKKAGLQAALKKNHDQYSSHRTHKLTLRRHNKISDYLHKSSKIIVDRLKQNNTAQLVIGYNPEWKQGVSLGTVNNQKFVSIPFQKFVEQLKYKCLREGIAVFIQEESYTSKTSALDLEPVQKQERYTGKRVKRGLFASREGILFNADVNGSLNIGRKAFGDEYAQYFIANRGYGYYPLRINAHKCAPTDFISIDVQLPTQKKANS